MGTKMKMYEVEFFLRKYDKDDDAERVVVSIPSDDIRQDIMRAFNTLVAASYGEYTYLYPGHMIQFARIKE